MMQVRLSPSDEKVLLAVLKSEDSLHTLIIDDPTVVKTWGLKWKEYKNIAQALCERLGLLEDVTDEIFRRGPKSNVADFRALRLTPQGREYCRFYGLDE